MNSRHHLLSTEVFAGWTPNQLENLSPTPGYFVRYLSFRRGELSQLLEEKENQPEHLLGETPADASEEKPLSQLLGELEDLLVTDSHTPVEQVPDVYAPAIQPPEKEERQELPFEVAPLPAMMPTTETSVSSAPTEPKQEEVALELPQEEQETVPVKKEVRAKKKTGWVQTIVMLILLLGGIGLGIFYFYLIGYIG